ncbi:MAG: tRNA (adenosine(37)-N6)-threonylcarbamoyltransferase complex dimerization subunit type 1 TsaB [Bacteroidales bacterium]|nr:tRNA (adenosine(37)-N6)-threonylcarbamoyltransferase complex dimerization subunit type 1 TsaB [Bacteroidales bacterium]MBR4689833.1 tRNA (adenosine(37)-N6)-threonylcarbamoyltransferase complex dimerization subunit type 1 TsaB [Bacteroidales bacterium]MBR7036128.1 tRNA (adenosine(37)-N6)-threonylcarbamoyltransferase complex dimerization subunit type 1 TsaB [Bacteroidales bacterium]
MKRILSIETATSVCSVALHEDGQCVVLKEISEPNAHSEKLTVLIEEALRERNITIADCDAVAISKGPGSYTGLRIGTSVAKGLCYACSLPLITVDTLEALALSCKNAVNNDSEDNIYMPMIDARRMEVYTSQWNWKMQNTMETNALVVTYEAKASFEPTKQYFLCGDGCEKCKETLESPNIQFFSEIRATAKTIGDIASEMFDRKEFADVAYFEPFYLKEFQATTPKKLL